MSLKKGNTTIGSIYKGTTPIGAIYKRTTLVFESAKWLPYSYEYLYHSLIPTTIDSKQVKNKAKVSTIYGNSVVENQLVENGDFASNSGWSVYQGTLSVSGGKATITGNGNATYLNIYRTPSVDIIVGHKYLMIAKCTSSKNSWNFYLNNVQSSSQFQNGIGYYVVEASAYTTKRFAIYGSQTSGTAGDTLEVEYFYVIDLTLAFGSGNEPTDINDPRIQYILNQGYIPTNATGTLKSVDCEVLPNVDFSFKCK